MIKFSKILFSMVLAAASVSAFAQFQQADINHIFIMGDVAANGSADTTIITNTTNANSLMFSTGLRNVSTTGATFTPLKESIEGGVYGETPCSGIGEKLALLQGASAKQYLFRVLSYDSHSGEDLSPQDIVTDVKNATALAKSQGKSYKVLGFVVMMEDVKSSSSESDAYYKDLLDTQTQLDIYLRQITGQSEPIRFFFPQTSTQAYYHSLYPTVSIDCSMAETELRLCVDHPDKFVFTGPAYQYDYCSNMLSPSAEAQKAIGAQIAVSINSVINGTNVAPLHASSMDVSGNTAQVTFSTPSKLVFDTTTVAKVDNYGFSMIRPSDSTYRELHINDIRLSTDSTLSITCDENIVAGDCLCYGVNGNSVGAAEGARGNLRDVSDESFEVGCQKFSLADWCPLFFNIIDSVAEPESTNVTGQITCEGIGVPGVEVSDGYVVTTTDESGHYYMTSNKKNGYVFYSVPRGYEPAAVNTFNPQFWAGLSSDVAVKETHDFTLYHADNDNYKMIIATDLHLANRTSDLAQFKAGFIPSVQNFVSTNSGSKIYSMFLGDMSWDAYWYVNKFNLSNYMSTMAADKYPTLVYHVMGNHDNDGSVPAGTNCDFLASGPFRTIVCPNYYSYNIGKVHYIVLDDIIYINAATAGATYNDGIVGSRNYSGAFTAEQYEWLKKDLDMITDKSTPIVIGFHIPSWTLSTNGSFSVNEYLSSSSSSKLDKMVADFPNVTLLSGHTHYNYHAHPDAYPNVHENNVAGVCGSWWWTGKLTGRQICKDGSPTGYEVFDVNGKDLTWKYHSIENNGDAQFRAYDMNTVRDYYANNDSAKKLLSVYSARTNYANVASNLIYVNVFNYDTDWKVEIFEGETKLNVTRIVAEDPLHNICYDIPRVAGNGSYTADFASNNTCHMFKATAASATTPVTVKVTDSFGNVYTETLTRPKAYNIHMN
ncbi:MAG: calcineurin-like phosphoesterase family protein [Muribaculaceae bacterium]|nr:calcineurin-like phosphoesterase family protein [Muribaculaceae bacterium]